MTRVRLCFLVLGVGLLAQRGWLRAQSLDDIQIHGFAAQSFLVSNHNNYLGMDTRNGTGDWSEAALNINSQVSDRLRVGIQLHYTRLGIYGGDSPTIDWALGDYRVNDHLAVRAGKVKLRWGLFNDTQDYDPGYLWSLLPESLYGIDVRTTNLSQNGIELRGKFPLGKSLGKLTYNAAFGYYHMASNDGILEAIKESGYTVSGQPGGKTPTLDARWETPLSGLMLGGSLMMYNATGNLTNGTLKQPMVYWPTGFMQYSHGKYYFSGQYARYVQYTTYNVTGSESVTSVTDSRGWFVMGSYHVTEKLQAGAYYSNEQNPAMGDTSLPANYAKDTVISSRWDFNSNFYAKLEGHFIDGYNAGFYSVNNSKGLVKSTDLLVGKIGFTF